LCRKRRSFASPDLYDESRATFEELGNKSSLAHTLSRLGDLHLIDGDLASARQKYEQALALRKQLGEKGSVGESQLALAQTSLYEGDPASAETAAKAASDEFRLANRPDDEASAWLCWRDRFSIERSMPSLLRRSSARKNSR